MIPVTEASTGGHRRNGATLRPACKITPPRSRFVRLPVKSGRFVRSGRNGKSGDGITAGAARIIRGLLPIRDAVRDVLRTQAADQYWREPQVRLCIAYSLGSVCPQGLVQ